MIQLYHNVSCLQKDLWDFAEERRDHSCSRPPRVFTGTPRTWTSEERGNGTSLETKYEGNVSVGTQLSTSHALGGSAVTVQQPFLNTGNQGWLGGHRGLD